MAEKLERREECCQTDYLGARAIPAFEIDQVNWCEDFTVNYFVSYAPHTSRDDWTEELAFQFKFCEDLSFVVNNFLDYRYENFPKTAGYAGFETGAMCINPVMFGLLEINEESKNSSCGDGSGYYNPTCRTWY